MHGLDLALGAGALVLDQGERAGQVGGKVLGVVEEVGEGGVDIGIGWWLAAEGAEVGGCCHREGGHVGDNVMVVVVLMEAVVEVFGVRRWAPRHLPLLPTDVL